MPAAVGIREVLITVPDRHHLGHLAKDIDTRAEVDRIYHLGTLGREHPVGKVDETGVIAEKWLHSAARKKVRLKPLRAQPASIRTLPQVERCEALRSRPIDHRQSSDLRR